MNIFDIIGPVMIGPSSSHTAGAVRLGIVAGKLFGQLPKSVRITLYESFADTGRGHGTDRAVLGGILGFAPDDERIRDSFTYAKKRGMDFEFIFSGEAKSHPNYVLIEMSDGFRKNIKMEGKSVGGGAIEVTRINTADVSFNALYHTLIVFSIDRFGTLAQISSILSKNSINIAFMRLSREKEGEDVVMVIETDQAVSPQLSRQIKNSENINDVIYISPFLARQGM